MKRKRGTFATTPHPEQRMRALAWLCLLCPLVLSACLGPGLEPPQRASTGAFSPDAGPPKAGGAGTTSGQNAGGAPNATGTAGRGGGGGGRAGSAAAGRGAVGDDAGAEDAGVSQ
jgi:hypothetical protein